MSIGKNISFFANGVNLAGALKSFEPTADVEILDSTVLNSTGAFRTYVQGFKNGSLSAEGVWSYDSTNEDEIHNLFTDAFENGTEMIITASLETLTVGNPAIIMNATEKSFSINPALGQLIMVSAEFQSNNAVNFGVWMFNASVDTETVNGTSIDNAVSSANGGILHVQTQQAGGTKLVDVKIQHSTNGTVWVDLAIIAQFDGANAARSAVVAAGTTVNRYTRVVATTDGDVAIQAAFARR